MSDSTNATTRAEYLLRRLAQNGKPMRVFLGFRSQGNGVYQLVASDDAAKLCKSLPRTEFVAKPGTSVAELAGRIADTWAQLTLERAAVPAVSAKPKPVHRWRLGLVKAGSR